jgi:hypothetical protein
MLCQARQGSLTHIRNAGLTHRPKQSDAQTKRDAVSRTYARGGRGESCSSLGACDMVAGRHVASLETRETCDAREFDGPRVQASTPEKPPAPGLGAAVTSASSGNKSKSSSSGGGGGGGGMDLMSDLKARLVRRRSAVGGADAQV